VIVAGASPGETKKCGLRYVKTAIFALAVRITGKLLKIDGYMLQAVDKHCIVSPSMQHIA